MENNKQNTRDAVLFVRINDEEKAELEKVVALQGDEMTVSRFVRETIREKIATIKAAAA